MGLNQNHHTEHFEDLTIGFADRLFRVAFARAGNVQDAEDIVQETYLKAYRSFESFREGTNVKSWLMQILINVVRDRHRRTMHRIETVELKDWENGVDEPAFASPEDLMIEDEVDPALSEALQCLSEQLAIPLILREGYDATYDEISKILDIPIGTVMSRLSRARAALRERLKARAPNKNSDKLERTADDL
ncbi:MAG: sigma-70 family RNA polymerase sigma factor [Cyanobacteria bacterium SZAS-4]|nr:sigma-70 family RNA polymerase sigma factor [Cyanobacteria bacterium SZAS-4]